MLQQRAYDIPAVPAIRITTPARPGPIPPRFANSRIFLPDRRVDEMDSRLLPMTQTFFFDLDGTLTDPMLGITGSIQHALRALDVEVPEAEDLTWCIGPPLLENFQILVGPDRAPQAVTYYRERFSDAGLYENTPYDGIHDALSTLRSAGVRLCVASSRPHIYVRKILEHFELIQYFGDVFGSLLDGTRSDKSELLRFALSEAQVDASNATMIGDRVRIP